MGIWSYLQLPFAQHAMEAAFLVALICGVIGPFVIAPQHGVRGARHQRTRLHGSGQRACWSTTTR